jgi:hypothetical protein
MIAVTVTQVVNLEIVDIDIDYPSPTGSGDEKSVTARRVGIGNWGLGIRISGNPQIP